MEKKKHEYNVIWRDLNFEENNEYSKYLEKLKPNIESLNINIFCISSTEKALKFILKKKLNKLIIITNIGKDLSGKRFIEIVRKILGFDIFVLFFSKNKEHFDWIKNFKNCLYTDKYDIFESYIKNYNMKNLNFLKKKIEEIYNLQLNGFTEEFIENPNNKTFDCINNINPYIRHVNIYCKDKGKYLVMKSDGNVVNSKIDCPWDITILDDEITFFSNGYYLKEEYRNIIGFKYMAKLNYKMKGKYFYFLNEKNNKILSLEENKVKFKNIVEPGENEIFELIDIPDKNDNLLKKSILSSNIFNDISSDNIDD